MFYNIGPWLFSFSTELEAEEPPRKLPSKEADSLEAAPLPSLLASDDDLRVLRPAPLPLTVGFPKSAAAGV